MIVVCCIFVCYCCENIERRTFGSFLLYPSFHEPKRLVSRKDCTAQAHPTVPIAHPATPLFSYYYYHTTSITLTPCATASTHQSHEQLKQFQQQWWISSYKSLAVFTTSTCFVHHRAISSAVPAATAAVCPTHQPRWAANILAARTATLPSDVARFGAAPMGSARSAAATAATAA